jgi:myo-inositol-1(or 4)-monophosphatase
MKGEHITMLPQDKWTQILIQCRDRVQKTTKLLLGEVGKPQPDLGVGAGGDPIKKIDLAAEKAIFDTLQKYALGFTLISEESGVIEHGYQPNQCYVTADPIDGSTNLTRGMPFYATSIAVSSEPTLAAVHTALVTDLFHGTTYMAQKGVGAFRDNERISSSTNLSVEDGVIGIDLNSYRIRKLAPRLTALMGEAKHMRHFGANALELCYVADGITDAFIDIRGKLRTTDIAAASLIISEAGGIITTPDGKQLKARLDPKQRAAFIAAGNVNIHKRILDLIAAQREKG